MRLAFSVLLTLLVSLHPAFAYSQEDVSVSLVPVVQHVSLDDRVTLSIKVSNTSGEPRYLHRNVLGPLEYGVKTSSGHALVWFNDPPLPPPEAEDDEDFIWLDAGDSLIFKQRLSLADLGIREAGTYRIYAFLQGIIATKAQRKSRTTDFFFTHSDPATVIVDKAPHK
jgi:hypothetical protein